MTRVTNFPESLTSISYLIYDQAKSVGEIHAGKEKRDFTNTILSPSIPNPQYKKYLNGRLTLTLVIPSHPSRCESWNDYPILSSYIRHQAAILMNFTQQKEVTRKLSDFDGSRARRVPTSRARVNSSTKSNEFTILSGVWRLLKSRDLSDTAANIILEEWKQETIRHIFATVATALHPTQQYVFQINQLLKTSWPGKHFSHLVLQSYGDEKHCVFVKFFRLT